VFNISRIFPLSPITINISLKDIPLGRLPSTKFAKGEYLAFPEIKSLSDLYGNFTPKEPIFSQWMNVYYLDWQRFHPSIPEFGPKRDKVEFDYNFQLFKVVEFMTDYLLLSLMGEARHYENSLAFHRMIYPMKCQRCLWINAYVGDRSASADGIWNTASSNDITSRHDMFKLLQHVFLEHVWLPGAVGGVPWGYLAMIGEYLNKSLLSGVISDQSIMLDILAHANHCSSNFNDSRFPWSQNIFDWRKSKFYNKVQYWKFPIPFLSALNAKAVGNVCCWKRFVFQEYIPPEGVLISRDVFPEGDYCKCYKNVPTRKLSSLQETFISLSKEFTIRKELCPTCENPISSRAYLSCESTCRKCNICIRNVELHQHDCHRCGKELPRFNDPASCKTYCTICEKCTRGWDHIKCHHCNDEIIFGGTRKYHHQKCSRCHLYAICPLLVTDKRPRCLNCRQVNQFAKIGLRKRNNKNAILAEAVKLRDAQRNKANKCPCGCQGDPDLSVAVDTSLKFDDIAFIAPGTYTVSDALTLTPVETTTT